MEPKDRTPHINVDYFHNLTGDISASKSADVKDVGTRIKMLREEKALSLEALSELTGYDVEFLARIEKAEVQPQLGTVIKLSKALDSAFGRLVSGAGEKLYSITRQGEHKTVSRSTSHKGQKQAYTYQSLAHQVKGRRMEPLIVQLEEVPDPEPSVHEGEEFIYVLAGTVFLKIGEDGFSLEPGDSAYYPSTTPHIITAKNGRATILAVLHD